LLGDVGNLADGRLPHKEDSNDAPGDLAPGRLTPEALVSVPWRLRTGRERVKVGLDLSRFV
jgi:hypothetical protein